MSERLTITIDMDRKCSSCRRHGATQCGLCLQCVTKKLLPLLTKKLLPLLPPMTQQKQKKQAR